MVEGLPNGDRLQLVIADLESMDNQSLEEMGFSRIYGCLILWMP